MMSRKIIGLVAIAVFFVFVTQSFAQDAMHGEARLAIRVVDSENRLTVLGQNEPSNKPGLFERMKRSFANWAKDDEDFEDGYVSDDDNFDEPKKKKKKNASQEEAASPTKPVAVPTKPPKPPTATEVRKASENPDPPTAGQRSTLPNNPTAPVAQDRRTASAPAAKTRTPATATPTTAATSSAAKPAPAKTAAKPIEVAVSGPETPMPEEAPAMETVEPVSEDTIFERLKLIREQVFDKQQIDESLYQEEYYQSASVRTAPTPTPAQRNDSKAVYQTPTERTPPPRSRMEERTSHPTTVQNAPVTRRGVEEYEPHEAYETYETQYEPRYEAPVRNRTSQADRQMVAERTLDTDYRQEMSRQDNVRRQNPQPMRNSPSSQDPQPSRLYSAEMERTSQLSGVEVHRNTQRHRTEARAPERTAPVVQEPFRRRNDEHEISARRRLASDQNEPLDKIASTAPEKFIPLDTPRSAEGPVREKTVLVSPRLEVETESEPRALVGQEATYKIRVANRGGAAAEQVVLSVEIPDWIDLRQPEVSVGNTSVVPRREGKDIRDFTWKISRIEANSDALLVLRLVPQERKSMDLRIRYDFFKPTAVAKLVVQEPVLEMELDGPAEVLWGTRVGYRLLVRNTGNGDAENVHLELLQTGSDMKSCELPVLQPGEEQVIDVDVWTGKQENIDINIQATGRYDLSATVSKRVRVMRPSVVMSIDAPTVQFVGAPAEFVVKVRNVGSATAKDLELAATLPLGARFDSCSAGGEPGRQNQVLWNIESIAVGDVFTATLVCEPQREGACKLDATVSDKSGVLTRCDSVFEAAAIVEMKLNVENPVGPVEVGREAVYTIQLVNRGTKAAENVEVMIYFGKHLEPFAIEGGTAYTSDGQVVFDKIPTIGPSQQVTLKVKARAEESGSHRVRTEVVCGASDIHLVNEQATYFYKKEKGKSTASSREETPKPTALRDEPRVKTAKAVTPETSTAEMGKLVNPVPAKPTLTLPTITPPPMEKKSEEKKPEEKKQAIPSSPPLPVLVPPAVSSNPKPADPFLQQ